MERFNKDSFWELIDQAKAACGDNLPVLEQWVEDKLVEMGPEAAKQYDYIAHAYRAAAYKYGLWTTANVLVNGCTDDGFTDFRGWLIAQGKDVYLAALKDPDSLADVSVPANTDFCSEMLCYVGGYAFETLTGQDINLVFTAAESQAADEEIAPEIEYGEGIGYPYTWEETLVYLPRLCAKYQTPEQMAHHIQVNNDPWNIGSLEVAKLRATETKNPRVINAQTKS